MNNDMNAPVKPFNSFRVLAGLIIIATGALLIGRNFDVFFFPHWVFGWYTILIIAGLYFGAKSNFASPVWLVSIVIGFIFMLCDAFPAINVWGLLWPLSLITIGAWYMSRHNKSKKAGFDAPIENAGEAFSYTPKPADEPAINPGSEGYTKANTSTYAAYGDDYLDAIAIFHTVKRNIISKNFRGGEITNVLGNTKIDFTQADIQQPVVIDVTQVLGNIKIAIPRGWHVVNDVASVFSAYKEKHMIVGEAIKGKVLVLKGTSLFSKIDVRNSY
jgi:predicted membrane protein